MLNALVLYRFSHSEASRFVENDLLPVARKHLRAITIRANPDQAGTIDYWLNAFYLANWLIDIVITVELAADKLSANVVTEQLNNLLDAKGMSYKKTMLRNYGLPAEKIEEFGELFRVTITDERYFLSKRQEIGRRNAILRLKSTIGGSGVDVETLLATITAACEARERKFATEYPKEYALNCRVRHLFEEDDAVQRNLRFHSDPADPTGKQPHAQDGGLRKFVKSMIYGEPGEEPPYKALQVREMLAHNLVRRDSFIGLSARVGVWLAGSLPSAFMRNSRNLKLFNGLAIVSTAVIWPFYWLLTLRNHRP